MHFKVENQNQIIHDESAVVALGVDLKKTKDSTKPTKYRIRDLHPGQYFGEVSILFDSLASATVKTLNYGLAGAIPKEKTLELFDRHPFYKSQIMRAIIREYDDDLRCFIMQTLRRIVYLHDVEQASDDLLHEMAFGF
jgi:CRP-like cAMP-binding protein